MIRLQRHRVEKPESLFVATLKTFSTASTQSGLFKTSGVER
jgi:hypothetical protein